MRTLIRLLLNIALPALLAISAIAQDASAEEDFRALQRYRIIGISSEGGKVAILLSHFGPSSQAPFVNLIIKEVGKSSVETIDSQVIFSGGGEQELKNLEDAVLKKNE